MMGNANMRGSVECLRLAKFPTFLRVLCHNLDLDLIMQVEKGLLRETVMYKVTGDVDALISFKRQLYSAIEEYNK